MPEMGDVAQAEIDASIATHAALASSHHTKYINAQAVAAAVQAGAITDAVTKAPTHDAVYDVKQTADVASKVVWLDANVEVVNDDARTETLDYTDLDLTASTSAAAKFAILELIFVAADTGSAGDSILAVRKNGTTPTRSPSITIVNVETNWVKKRNTVIVGLDANQVIEYAITVATDATVYSDIHVLGYIE